MEDMEITVDLAEAEEGLENAAALARQARAGALREAAAGMCDEMRSAVDHPAAKGENNSPLIHTRTGNLLQSLDWDYEEDWDMAIARAGDITGAAPYAAALEEGTVKMRSRPFLGPALLTWAQGVAERMQSLFSGGKDD